MARIVTPALRLYLRRQFRLDWHGDHGGAHWARVHHHGQVLGRQLGADLRVVELFAFLHDSQRQDEYDDPGHGHRAADFAEQLRRRGDFELDDHAFDLLQQACRGHSDGLLEADLTVQVCWDADRLDLGRVGIKPDPRRLATAAARDPVYLERAWRWSLQQGERREGAPLRRGWYSDENGMTRLRDW